MVLIGTLYSLLDPGDPSMERPPDGETAAVSVSIGRGRYRASSHDDTSPGAVHTYTDDQGKYSLMILEIDIT